ncbi:MAG: Gfo/Idh/MocA family oxidoreductase [candidate division Zixibacteria bacterium]|nr:Gfo/Idh/MocA family oxidoreductase [candidate division Zixibacteria bacterium]
MDTNLDFDYRPKLGTRRDFGIGIIGAGAIVNAAHLPAYRKAGFNVVGITDADVARARETARKFEIAKVYETVEALVDDPAIHIVDIAVPPWNQLGLVRQAAAAGKHILCQKPLSNVYVEAVEIVQLAGAAGVKLAVNQQMRWDQAVRSARTLLSRGWLGDPVSATIDVGILTDWSAWPWLLTVEGLDLMYHSIHYFDSMRSLFGDPKQVWSVATRYPEQKPIGETHTHTLLDYASTFRALVAVNHNNWTTDRFATLRIEGTHGYLKGTFGLLYNYPYGRPDTLEFYSRAHYPHLTFQHVFEEMWIPDSFIGPMGELMRAIGEGREPETSGTDNLHTLRIVHAAYRSIEERRAVSPDEIA